MSDSTDPSTPPRERPKRRVPLSLMLHDGDRDLINFGTEFLGCTKSEFVRSAIRAYSMSLQALARKN